MNRTIIILLYLITSNVLASSIEELKERNTIDVKTEKGKKYEALVATKFWGPPYYMPTCLPKNSPLPHPFTILFEILPSGKMNNLIFTTNTTLTKCISDNVKNKSFQKIKKPFVVRINLRFEK